MIFFGKGFILRLYCMLQRISWLTIAVVLAVLFFGCGVSMAYFEGEAPIAQGRSYWWYFIVTATTVGYGDLFPVTTGGRITAAFIMVFGIGLIAITFTRIAETIFQYSRKRMKGQLALNVRGHIIVLGYSKGYTEKLVAEILADTPEESETIVLCDGSLDENPMSGTVEFVCGDPASDDVLKRACAAEAKGVFACGADDNKTFLYAVAANHHAAKAHIIAYFHNEATAINLGRISTRIECITSVSVPMIVHAMQDPGIPSLFRDLISHGGPTVLRLNIPEGFIATDFFTLMSRFKERHNVTLVAVGACHAHDTQLTANPPWGTVVRPGMSLFYIGNTRLNGGFDWSSVESSTQGDAYRMLYPLDA